MATLMQVKAEPSVEQAIQQIIDIEVEGKEEDPLEGLNNKEIAEIYKKLTPEDRQLFRHLKKFHKLHYELYGHDVPSHQLTNGIINQMFSGIPAKDAEVIAAARAEILAAERLKSLCKQLGLVVPTELQQCQKLLHMVGAGDEEHIITKVLPGTDPLQEFDEDDP